MITTVVRDFIPVASATAFDYAAEMRNLDQWGVGVRAVEQVAGNGPAVGARYRCTMFSAHGPKASYDMIALDPGKSFVMRGETDQLQFTDTYHFEPGEDGVYVTLTDELQIKGWGGLLEGILRPLMKIQIGKDVANLKAALIPFASGNDEQKVHSRTAGATAG
jgi:hypothetical protein